MAVFNNSYSDFLEFRVEKVVSSNVKKYIKKSGYTCDYLSMRTGLSLPTIYRLKEGQHLSIRGICALAEVLSVDPLEFFKEVRRPEN